MGLIVKAYFKKRKNPQLPDIKTCYLLFLMLNACLKKPAMFSILCDELNINLFCMEKMHHSSSADPSETSDNSVNGRDRKPHLGKES